MIQSMKDEIGAQATAGWADVAGKIRESLVSIAPELTAIGTTITTKLQEVLTGAAEGITTEDFKAKLNEFNEAIKGIDIGAVVTGVTEAFRALSAAASGVAGVISGLASAFQQLGQVASAFGTIAQGVKDFSPSKIAEGMGQLGGALREDYKKTTEQMAADQEQVASKFIPTFQRQMEEMPAGAKTGIWDSIKGMFARPPEAAPPAAAPAVTPAEAMVKPDVSELKAAIAETEIKVPDLSAAGAAGGEALGSSAASGINAAGSSGGQAFSGAAQSGITAAGSAGGAAFAAAINPGAIGSAIGAAAAAAISAAKVNVNVTGSVTASGGGGTSGGATTGKDSPS
jgi:hypothetical protein